MEWLLEEGVGMATIPLLRELDLERLRAQDEAEFADLVVRLTPRVWRVCFTVLGNAAEAEDTVQEVFLRAWKALPRFRGDSGLGTWVYRIALNTARSRLSWLRRRFWHRQESLSPPQHDGPTLDLPHPGASPEATSSRRQTHDKLMLAVAKLPRSFQEVIILRDIEDLDYPDIANVLDIPRGTVKSRLNRARQRLADELRAEK